MLPESPLPARPLLTLAIPTFNRAGQLDALLASIAAQASTLDRVELLVSDNASTDETPEVIARYQALGLNLTLHRHAENVGSDRNFISCFEKARGVYFWLCGDDEFLLPEALETLLPHLDPGTLDMVYVTSYGFVSDPLAERREDPLGRISQTVADPLLFARLVNVMFTSISSIVVHRDRLLELQSTLGIEPPSAYLDTNLPQLAWCLPLLRTHRQSLVLWQRTVGGRLGANGGYNLALVFGSRLTELLARLLPDRPDIVRAILGVTLRRWFPSTILSIRATGNDRFSIEEAGPILRRLFGRHPTFWIFTWPVLTLPLSLARVWEKLGSLAAKAIALLLSPARLRRKS